MKRFILFALAHTIFSFSLPISLYAQDNKAPFTNYVVIGAFAHEKNAMTFTEEAKQNKYPARFEMNPYRHLYYVYVLTTDDREYARAEALRLRAETKYFDAWVYSGAFGNIEVATLPDVEQHDINPVTGQRLADVSAGEEKRSSLRTPGDRPQQDAAVQQQVSHSRNVETPQASRRSDSSVKERKIANQSQQGSTVERDGDHSVEHEGDLESPDRSHLSQESLVQSNTRAQLHGQRMNGTVNASTAQQPEIQITQGDHAPGRDGQPTDVSREEKGADGAPTHFTERSEGKTNASDTSISEHGKSGGSIVPLKDQVSTVTSVGKPRDEIVNIPPPERQSTQQLSPEDVVGKNFYFYLYRADNLNTVPGEVDAIDFEKSRKMGTYPANEGVKITMAGGKMKHISFVCQVFGYRKQQQEFDPENLSEQLYLDNNGNLVVPFELVRLQKGDIAIMYNVFFFKDAAMMRPESRYEVNNLLDLLVENPSYKIVIHGHTNGNASGKIIRMDKPGNFYSLSGTKQGFGSAKQLSEERAILIREFLISSGISANRMEVKAWGGKKPIHDKHSVRAHENVRVEIEILSQ